MKTHTITFRIGTRQCLTLFAALATLLGISVAGAAHSIIHYRVNDSDDVSSSVPNNGSLGAGETVGGLLLSTDVPVLGIPADAGNRSLAFNGSSGVKAPGTQQLLNSAIASNGGFTYEAWFKYTGDGNVNSIIDYAGTEKLDRPVANSGPRMQTNNAIFNEITTAEADEWHYVAIVFNNVSLDGNSVSGDYTYYFDGATPLRTVPNITINDFGDSLNRTIGVGMHPQGFAGDFFNGLIYEPRVTLGALPSSQLLYKSAHQTDSFGYHVEEARGPNAIFSSILSSGEQLTFTRSEEGVSPLDDGWAERTPNVPFAFYGTRYNSIRISTNGYIALDNRQIDNGGDFTNDPVIPTLPDRGTLLNEAGEVGKSARIYPFHDDLVIGASGGVFYEYQPFGIRSHPFRPSVGVTIIEWRGMQHVNSDTSDLNFQALLFDDGAIQFNYQTTASSSLSFTPSIGIQNGPATDGLDIYSSSGIGVDGFDKLTYSILPPERVVTSRALFGNDGTLYETIRNAPNPCLITFAPNIFPGGDANVLELFDSNGVTRFLNHFKADQTLTIDASSVCGITLSARNSENGGSTLIQNKNGAVVILNSLNITGGDNSSTPDSNGYGGGIANFNGSRLTLLNCAVYDNFANVAGGGISNRDSYLRAINSTITRSLTPGVASGIYLQGGAAEFEHCTIADQRFAVDGFFVDNSHLTLRNCIVSNPPQGDTQRDLNGNGGSTLVLEGTNLIGSNEGPFKAQLGTSKFIGTASAPVDPLLAGGMSKNGGATFNYLLLPGSKAIDEAVTGIGISGQGPDQRGRFPVGTPDLGAVEAEWGATLDETDFVSGPAFDFMLSGANLTTTEGAITGNSATTLINDNDENTGAGFFAFPSVTLTTDLSSRSFRPRGIRIVDPTNTVGAVLLYGSNNGLKFDLLGSADVAGSTTAGMKEFFLKSSSTTDHLPFRKPYRQFRAQFLPIDPVIGSLNLTEFEFLVEGPESVGIDKVARLNSSAFILTVTVQPGTRYQILTSPDLKTPFSNPSDFTTTTNPGVFGATVIVPSVSETRGFYQLRKAP
ncbi:choice-of-anchor Q domain-containing protein [Verrucomicrobiaceae bacterium 227]